MESRFVVGGDGLDRTTYTQHKLLSIFSLDRMAVEWYESENGIATIKKKIAQTRKEYIKKQVCFVIARIERLFVVDGPFVQST